MSVRSTRGLGLPGQAVARLSPFFVCVCPTVRLAAFTVAFSRAQPAVPLVKPTGRSASSRDDQTDHRYRPGSRCAAWICARRAVGRQGCPPPPPRRRRRCLLCLRRVPSAWSPSLPAADDSMAILAAFNSPEIQVGGWWRQRRRRCSHGAPVSSVCSPHSLALPAPGAGPDEHVWQRAHRHGHPQCAHAVPPGGPPRRARAACS